MDAKNLKIIMIHGNGGGTGQDFWFPYVQTGLEALGLNVIAPTFPDNVLARESYWLPYLVNELKADEKTIIIGWSSGAVAAMRYAEKHTLYGSVLIGACYTDLGLEDEKIAGYYDRPWNWEAIRNNQKWITQFASSDDPVIDVREPRYIHEKLETEYTEFSDQGHFYPKEEFPEVVNALRKKLNLA